MQTTGEIRDAGGTVVATAGGKYVPLPPDRNREFVRTLVDDPSTADAAAALLDAAGGRAGPLASTGTENA